MKRISIVLSIALSVVFASSAHSTTSLDEAWMALFEHRIEDARFWLESELDEEGRMGALSGLLLTAWTQGEIPEASRYLAALVEEYPNALWLPAWLAIGSQSPFQGWTLREREASLRKALQHDLTPMQRSILKTELAGALDMQLKPEAFEAAREAGTLIDHWRIVGPFGRFGAADFFHPYGPERAWRESYSGWQTETSIRPIEPSSPTGMIFLEGLAWPQTGVFYLINVIDSNQETDATLSISSQSDLRVWINGKPIVEKSGIHLDTSTRVSTPISLREGKNLLVIKTPSIGAGWLRAQLHPTAQAANRLDFATVPFDLADWRNATLRPFESVQTRGLENQGSASLYPMPLTDELPKIGHGVQNLLVGAWHLDRREFDAARERFQAVIDDYPNFVLAYALLGETRREQARARSDSRTRFMQEAENAYTKALEIDPLSKIALAGLQSYYLEQDQTDQALDLAKERLGFGMEYSLAGYNGQLDSILSLIYDRKGFADDAVRLLENVRGEFLPGFDALNRLFDHYQTNRRMERAVDVISEGLDRIAVHPGFLRRALQLDVSLEGRPDVNALLERRIEHHPQALGYALDLGRAYENEGRLEDATKLYKQLAERFPDHPQPKRRIAQLQLAQGEWDVAETAYSEIYEQAPVAMEPFRALRDGFGRRDFPYLTFDAQLEDIDVSKADRWLDSRASGIYLLDIMVLEFFPDGTYAQYIHQAIKILNQEGVREWAEVVIPKGDNIEIIEARTITPDGTVWDVDHVQDLSNQQALSMYGVEEGAIIEYAYLERGGRTDPGLNVNTGAYYFGADNDPMLLSRLVMIRPESLTLHLDLNPEDFHPDRVQEEGREVLIWENRLQDGLKPERFAPPLAERVPSVQWSTADDWLPFVERLRLASFGAHERSARIESLAEELKTEARDAADIVQRVYEWIQQNIEEAGGGATTADTIALRAGRTGAKINLARQLLHHCGIESRVVLALDNRSRNGFRPLPFPAYPGTYLLQVPRQEGILETMSLNFESRFAPMGQINPTVIKMAALIYDEPVPYFEPLRSDLWEHGLLDRELNLIVRQDRAAVVEGVYRYGNLFDRQVRELLTNPEIRARLADAQVSNDLRGIRLNSSSFEALEDLSQNPRLEFVGMMPDVAQPAADGALELRPVLSRVRASGLLGEPEREYPVVFETSPAQDPLSVRIDLSTFLRDGARIELPDNAFIISEFGFYSVFYAWEGDAVIIRRSFLIPPQTIEPDRYSHFTSFCREIDQIEERSIRIIPPSNEGNER